MRDDVGIRATDSCKNEAILIVDDQDQVLNVLEIVFSEIGYRVITAFDGQDAVDKFTDNVDSVDIILMDIIMPRKNGVEAYKEICSLKPNVPIVFMSGFTANHIEGLNPDAINMVLKPINPLRIAKRIRETLDGVYHMGDTINVDNGNDIKSLEKCEVKHVCSSIYECKSVDPCSVYRMSFGYKYFCKHPNAKDIRCLNTKTNK